VDLIPYDTKREVSPTLSRCAEGYWNKTQTRLPTQQQWRETPQAKALVGSLRIVTERRSKCVYGRAGSSTGSGTGGYEHGEGGEDDQYLCRYDDEVRCHEQSGVGPTDSATTMSRDNEKHRAQDPSALKSSGGAKLNIGNFSTNKAHCTNKMCALLRKIAGQMIH